MDKRIKILYTIPNFDTAGSGKVVYDLVKHIDKTRFEPHICCKHSKGTFFKQVQALGVPIHMFDFCTPYRPFISLPLRILKIRSFLKKHRFQVVHSWHWSSDVTEPLAAKLAGIPFVYTKKAMGWSNKAWLWRSKLSKKIICINTDMVEQFFSKLSYKVVSIPIGLDIKDFGILEKTFKTKDGHETNQNDFVVTSIANLVPVKGIEYLLDAVVQINHQNIKVFVVGDTSSDYAKALMKTYSSTDIVFTGKKQDIKDYLALTDLFVIPTKNEGRKEGQPIAPIEAMLSGRIVLGSRISGIKDVLAPFPQLLFQPESVQDLTFKIQEMIAMGTDERKILAEQLYKYASEEFNIKNSIRQHEKLYINLVS